MFMQQIFNQTDGLCNTRVSALASMEYPFKICSVRGFFYVGLYK